MRLSVFCICMVLAAPLFSQSKKELQATISKLKTELSTAKEEQMRLQKSMEADVSDTTGQASYGLAVIIATNMKNQGLDSLDVNTFAAGVRDVFSGDSLKVNRNQAEAIVQQYMQKVMEKKAAKAREAGQVFLDKNKAVEGIKVTPSGLQYKVITSGKGKTPGPNDRVTVHYTGKLTDGTVFDSSVERGEPIQFGVSEVIPGWTEAMQLMKEGDKWMLYIPYNLGYGERGAGPQIPPYSTLIFEVELIKVN
jgi:FKBP-type peptidyl-prolyl cis-trans isomerase